MESHEPADPSSTESESNTRGIDRRRAVRRPGGRNVQSGTRGRQSVVQCANGWFDPTGRARLGVRELPPEMVEYEQFMAATQRKSAFAAQLPEPEIADDEKDPRFKWANPENWTTLEATRDAARRCDSTRTRAVAFVMQRESEPYREPADPFLLFDGDDVVNDDGDVHPAFIELVNRVAPEPTFAEYSQSNSGIHVPVHGRFPDGVKSLKIDLPDVDGFPGAHVDVFDGKHLAVMTGKRIAETPLEISDVDPDVLDALVAEQEQAQRDARDAARRAQMQQVDGGRFDSGPTPKGWDVPADRSLDYYAVVRAFCDRYAAVLNWRLEGAAAAYGARDGLSVAEIDRDLAGALTGGESAGYDAKTRGRIEADYRRAEQGEFSPASTATLAQWGVLPEECIARPTHVPVLPNVQRRQWWEADDRDGALTKEAARKRTREAIAKAYDRADDVLIHALPTLGKTYSSVAAAADTGTPVSVLTTRGREEQYAEIAENCEAHGLSYAIAPSFKEDCPTANGEHGEHWKRRVDDWYAADATGQVIHKLIDTPCQEHGRCPYSAKWDFDADDVDVIIGHYTHGHVPKVANGRTVIYDEFPEDALESTIKTDDLGTAVSRFLADTPALPFDNVSDLRERRHDPEQRRDALAWFSGDRHLPDPEQALTDGGHALAPTIVYALLKMAEGKGTNGQFCNAAERAKVDAIDGIMAVYDREEEELSIYTPPTLRYARNVVALDGTPTKEMWEAAINRRLNERRILTDAERAEYITETLGLRIVRTTESIKPYNSPGHVHVKSDAALLEAIHEQYGEKPAVLTSKVALEQEYRESAENGGPDPLAHAGATGYRGNLLGSNRFADERLGVYIGSSHYGDDYVRRWAGYCGETAEANRNLATGEGRGVDLSYGPFGDKILRHMREHETLQGVMRFGRDGGGAIVFVDTNTLPNWVPVADEGRVLRTRSRGEERVITALSNLLDGGNVTTADVAAHPDVQITERQVWTHLDRLAERGILSRVANPDDRRGYVWFGDEFDPNENGDVDLPSVRLDAPPGGTAADEVAEVEGIVPYTWDFRKFDPNGVKERSGTTTAPATDETTLPDASADSPPPG